MKLEKSCGAVIYRTREDTREYLILTAIGGHHTLCKGHVEEGETEHDTALREIREETGLSVELADGFRHVIRYSPYPGCMKDVVFFAARVTGGELVCQPEEVAAAEFLPLEAAAARITHASDRETLLAAEKFLSAR